MSCLWMGKGQYFAVTLVLSSHHRVGFFYWAGVAVLYHGLNGAIPARASASAASFSG